MATITITTTAPQDARLVVAFGNRLQTRDANNVRRNATAAEIRAELIRHLRDVVVEDERAVAAKTAAEAVAEFSAA